jgi:hypothetical protein
MKAFYEMTLREIAAWVEQNNTSAAGDDIFCTGEFPSVDDLSDEEEQAAREEYESMAEEIVALRGAA